MPNPKSGTFDLGDGVSPDYLAPLRHERASRAGNAIRALASRFLAWRARQATLRLLRSLDAATLRDLGLSDIDSEVYGDPRDRVRGYDANWWKKHGA